MAGIPRILPYQIPRSEEVTENIANWKVDPRHVVLLVHDMQRFFLRALPGDMAKPLIANVATLIQWARAHTVPVAYTAQPGRMTP